MVLGQIPHFGMVLGQMPHFGMALDQRPPFKGDLKMHNKWIETPPTPIPPPVPATLTPVPDNEGNTTATLRTGIVGASLKYAREDHNHPVRKQVAPIAPTLVFQGASGSTMPQSLVLDTWTDEESVTYAYRIRVDLSANTGWNVISIPAMIDFQRPQITIEGTYRNTGNPSTTQPRAPYMGCEANHWSSTQRIYIGQYNQKVSTGRYYVAITVRYVRN